MKEYILSLVCAAVASSVLGLIFHGDETLGKYARLAVSLCLVASLVPGGIKGINSLEQKVEETSYLYENETYLSEITDSYDRYIIENARGDLCSQLKILIFEKSGIMPDDVCIEFNTNVEKDKISVSIKSVYIISDGLVGNKEIEEYVYELTKVKPIIQEKSGDKNANDKY